MMEAWSLIPDVLEQISPPRESQSSKGMKNYPLKIRNTYIHGS